MIYLDSKHLINTNFPNGEAYINTRDIDTTPRIAKLELQYVDDRDLFRLLFIKKYLLQNNIPADLLIRYMPYSRMDRREGDSCFTLKYVADFINDMKFRHVYVVEPHSDITMALLNNSIAIYPSIDLIRDVIGEINFDREQDFLFFPDAGAQKRYSKVKNYKQMVGFKQRDFETGELGKLSILGGDCAGKKVLIVDDLCSKGGTFIGAADILKGMGASEIYLLVTHCEDNIFNGNVLDGDLINKVFTTNSMIRRYHPNIHVYMLEQIL